MKKQVKLWRLIAITAIIAQRQAAAGSPSTWSVTATPSSDTKFLAELFCAIGSEPPDAADP